MNQIINSLNWRYATKKFDTNKKISPENLDVLIESIRLTPTSFGLPFFRIINITDPELRTKIQEAAYGQAQITESSHLFAIITPKLITAQEIDKYLQQTSSTRNIPLSSLDNFRQMLLKTTMKTPSDQTNWIQKQAYVGLGFLLFAAASLQIDSCPMEGFNSIAVHQILGLGNSEDVVLLCPLGYRHSDDTTSDRTKIRQDITDFIETK